MYKVERNDGRVTIIDWNDKAIYSVPEDAYVTYRPSATGGIFTAKVKDLKDDQLLTALANAVKLSL